MAKAQEIYTEEELKTVVSLDLTLRDILRVRSSINKRLKQRENYLPKMKRAGQAAHLIQMEEISIGHLTRLIETLDAVLDEFDERSVA